MHIRERARTKGPQLKQRQVHGVFAQVQLVLALVKEKVDSLFLLGISFGELLRKPIGRRYMENVI
jgi:hypothetical protein